MTSKIERIVGREILDSRGNPTVEVDLYTSDGMFRASAPSGASTGSFEAIEKRDGGGRYGGKGVLKAVEAINTVIAPALVGSDPADQEGLDRRMIELDGTENKGNLGGNAIVAVSIAAAKAGAAAKGIPVYAHIAQLSGRGGTVLPIPQMNVINGGKHAGVDDDVQEHLIMAIGAGSFTEALRMSAETYHALKGLIKEECGVAGIHLGDEGGFVPPIDRVEERLEMIKEAIDRAGYTGGIFLAIDSAASEFYRDGAYHIRERTMTPAELVEFYAGLVEKYPIVSIEDGMAEEDWDGWRLLTEQLGSRIQIIGDDVFVSNPKRVKRGIDEGSANALLLKVNQIGTVTEAIEAAKLALDASWNVIVSHRSGETEDPFIADLVVGLDVGQSKFGAPARSERTAKYNRLLRIEEELAGKGTYSSFSYPLPGS